MSVAQRVNWLIGSPLLVSEGPLRPSLSEQFWDAGMHPFALPLDPSRREGEPDFLPRRGLGRGLVYLYTLFQHPLFVVNIVIFPRQMLLTN
ncbi:MAG: hypothetical protein DHS20C20_09480 [Ardenticatenaceae bacterium]|nr:MAG: hypothetical protein DHS20C20_09480 [Ardenticatenaceae bacterium]